MESCKTLAKFVESDDFCNGQLSISAYNTAWVARIRSLLNSNKPAFPASLDWIRNNQLSDGSWGSLYPVLIFERIISTLIAVICLKQWSKPKDQHLIDRGVNFICKHLVLLANLDQIENKMTIGFELILPCLIDEATKYGLHFDQEQIVQIYRKEREMKLQKIQRCELADFRFNGPKPWYFSLEALEFYYTDEQVIKMVDENCLICCSFSATAFALFKGIKIDQSYKYTSKIISENTGGVPSLYKVEVFDMGWSINTLIFAGFQMDLINLEPVLSSLESLWLKLNGMLGACVGLPPDADDIANSLFALSTTKRINDLKSLDSLLKFFRKNYFITFEGEKYPSLSTNINCLICLKNFQVYPEIKKITQKVYEWTKTQFIQRNFNIEDKWDYSRYYPLTRAIFAFEYIDKDITDSIYDILWLKQNHDGGCGSNNMSSYLESSYVIISIIYCIKNSRFVDIVGKNTVLRKAKQYMDVYENQEISLWINKVLYSPINVDKTSILAAKYVLDNFLF